MEAILASLSHEVGISKGKKYIFHKMSNSEYNGIDVYSKKMANWEFKEIKVYSRRWEYRARNMYSKLLNTNTIDGVIAFIFNMCA